MSVPPYSLQQNQTWSGNSSFGIGQTTQTSGMPLLSSSSSGPDRMPSTNDNWKPTNLPVNIKVNAGALSDDTQTKYSQGSILFVKDPERDTIHGDSAIYALQNLNYALEKARRNFLLTASNDKIEKDLRKMNNEITETEQDSERRKSYSAADKFDTFPMFPDAFAESLHLLGIMHSDQEKSQSRRRELGVTTANRVTLPNFFGNVPVGAQVGLMVKFIDNPYNGFIDINGNRIGDPTPGPILQVRAHYEPQSNIPIHSTAFLDPAPNDLDSWTFSGTSTMRSIPEASSENINDPRYDSGNRVKYLDWDKVKSGHGTFNQKVLKFSKYCQGYYIPLGVVMMVGKVPSGELANLAHRSFQHFNQLRSECSIEIQLDQKPFNQITLL